MFTKEIYIARRNHLKSTLKSGILLFPGNGEMGMNCKDNWYPFRQDSTFLYYTGVNIPDVYFVIDVEKDEEILFGNNPTPEEIVWIGATTPLEELAAKAGIKKVKPLSELANYIKNGKQQAKVHYLPPYRSETTIQLSELLDIPVQEVAGAFSVALTKAIVAQREIKITEEVQEITKAVNITAEMHTYAIKNGNAGKTEKQIAGDLQARTEVRQPVGRRS